MSWVNAAISTDFNTLARTSSVLKFASDALPSSYKTIATSWAAPDPPSVKSNNLLSLISPWVTCTLEDPDNKPFPPPEPSFVFSKEVSIALNIWEEDIPAPVKSIAVPPDWPFTVIAVVNPTTRCVISREEFLALATKSADSKLSVLSDPVDVFAELSESVRFPIYLRISPLVAPAVNCWIISF